MLHVRSMTADEHISLPTEGTFNFSRYLEKILLQKVVNLLNLPFSSFSGYVTTGATEATIYALWLAREWALKALVDKSERITWLIPKNVHYSALKALTILGIAQSDAHTIEYVELDALGRTDLQQLEQKISAAQSTPIILVLTAMTTEYGLIDPITEIDTFIRNSGFKNIFFHVDAAFSGFLLPYVEEYKHFFNLPSLSSIALDFHKNLGGPVGSGAVIVRGGLERYAKVEARYLSDGADYTLTGSRKGADVLATWAILATNTYENRKKTYAKTFKKTKYLAEKLSVFPFIKLLYPPKFNYIVFTIEREKKDLLGKLLKNFSITSSKVILNGNEVDLFKIIIRKDHSLRAINRLIKTLTVFYEGGT